MIGEEIVYTIDITHLLFSPAHSLLTSPTHFHSLTHILTSLTSLSHSFTHSCSHSLTHSLTPRYTHIPHSLHYHSLHSLSHSLSHSYSLLLTSHTSLTHLTHPLTHSLSLSHSLNSNSWTLFVFFILLTFAVNFGPNLTTFVLPQVSYSSSSLMFTVIAYMLLLLLLLGVASLLCILGVCFLVFKCLYTYNSTPHCVCAYKKTLMRPIVHTIGSI